ncbi:MAG TPA: NAD(P)/FAD-dependent oxidoreductase [Candidatus Deferrimicrobium sp.]|nr:NAD(P)/FAD-dependent oxidoreductase [Candidatus Deferrimicrobium sp.]
MPTTADILPQQVPLRALPHRVWDVCVVGAGPAGATCAWALATRGMSVLVVDKDRFPRSKACGDFLIADTLNVLTKMGLLDRVRSAAHVVPVMEISSPAGIRFEVAGPFLTLKRADFDAVLMAHVTTAGATFAHASVTDVRAENGNAHVNLHFHDPQADPAVAKIAVLATGAVATLPQRCGLVTNSEPSAVAIRRYIRSQQPLERALIYYHASTLPGYFWIIPLGQDPETSYEYNVGCGMPHHLIKNGKRSLKQSLEQLCLELPEVQRIVREAEAISPIEGAALRCGMAQSDRAQHGNVLAVGEAVGTTLPFTGEGIGKAMESSLIAAESIYEALTSRDNSRLGQYRSELESRMKPRYAAYARAERWLARPRLNDLMARRIAKRRWLQERLSDIMSDRGDPRSVFGIYPMLLSIFKGDVSRRAQLRQDERNGE